MVGGSEYVIISGIQYVCSQTKIYPKHLIFEHVFANYSKQTKNIFKLHLEGQIKCNFQFLKERNRSFALPLQI